MRRLGGRSSTYAGAGLDVEVNGMRVARRLMSGVGFVLLSVAACDRATNPAAPRAFTPKGIEKSVDFSAPLLDVRLMFAGERVPNPQPFFEEPPRCLVGLSAGSSFVTSSACGDNIEVPEGTYDVVETWFGTEVLRESLTFASGQTVERDVDMTPYLGRLTGRLTRNGQPVADHSICQLICTTSGADGRFSVFSWPGSGQIYGKSYNLSVGQTLDLGDVDYIVGLIRFDVSYQGQPVTDVYTCGGYFVLAGSYNGVSCGTTRELPPGTGTLTSLGWMTERLPDETVTIVAGQTLTRSLDISSRAGVLAGTLTVNGQPAANKLLFLQGSTSPGYQVQVTTGADGSFSALLPAGAGQFIIGSWGTSYDVPYTVVAGQRNDAGAVSFTLPAARAELRFKGERLGAYDTNCEFDILFPNSGLATQPCDGAPNALPAGQYDLRVNWFGAVQQGAVVNLALGQTQEFIVDLTPKAGKLTGQATLNGRPAAKQVVCATSDDPQFTGAACTQTDDRGVFSMIVPAGSGKMKIGQRAVVTYTVSAGQILDFGTTSDNKPGQTNSGSNVATTPVDPTTGATPATITFGNVTSGGTTSVTTSGTGTPPTDGFRLGNPPVYYEIATTAQYSGTITICINYDPADFKPAQIRNLKLMHRNPDGTWSDVTTSNDPTTHVICGQTTSLSPFTIAARNQPPVARLAASTTAFEGSSVTASAAGSADADGDPLVYEFDFGDGTAPVTSSEPTATHVYGDNGTRTITVVAREAISGGVASAAVTSTVSVTNVPPTVGAITGLPNGPIAAGTPVTLSTQFTDPGSADTHVATLEWDVGNSGAPIDNMVVAESNGAGTTTVTRALTAGVYTVRLTVTDDDGGSATVGAPTYIVVYDPGAGFVTGGGWLTSPTGACQLSAACAGASGRANFGFVSRYQRGARVPNGNTEFDFQAGQFRFTSTSYEWLVIAGSRAQYKGEGTVNGGGRYGFLLTAIDGDVSGGGGMDRLRLKVWDVGTGAIVYDNQLASPDDSNASTALGGGSVVIHNN